MSEPKVLFIGGSGVISSASSRLAVARGIDLYVLNRGTSHDRPLPPNLTQNPIGFVCSFRQPAGCAVS